MPPAREIPPHLVEVARDASSPVAMLPLYSDIAASRPPSPQKEASSVTAVHSTMEPNNDRVFITPSSQSGPANNTVSNHLLDENIEQYTSSDEGVSPQDQGDTQWTTVRRRRARSLGSLERSHSGRSNCGPARELTTNQVRTVEAAAEQLTKSQKKRIHHRYDKVKAHHGSSVSSREEGTSRQKGKGIDPENGATLTSAKKALMSKPRLPP